MPSIRRSRQVEDHGEQDADDIDEDSAYEPPQNSHGSKSSVTIKFRPKAFENHLNDRGLMRQDSLPSPMSMTASSQLIHELEHASEAPTARYGHKVLTTKIIAKWILIPLLLASMLVFLLPKKKELDHLHEGLVKSPDKSCSASAEGLYELLDGVEVELARLADVAELVLPYQHHFGEAGRLVKFQKLNARDVNPNTADLQRTLDEHSFYLDVSSKNLGFFTEAVYQGQSRIAMALGSYNSGGDLCRREKRNVAAAGIDQVFARIGNISRAMLPLVEQTQKLVGIVPVKQRATEQPLLKLRHYTKKQMDRKPNFLEKFFRNAPLDWSHAHDLLAPIPILSPAELFPVLETAKQRLGRLKNTSEVVTESACWAYRHLPHPSQCGETRETLYEYSRRIDEVLDRVQSCVDQALTIQIRATQARDKLPPPPWEFTTHDEYLLMLKQDRDARFD